SSLNCTPLSPVVLETIAVNVTAPLTGDACDELTATCPESDWAKTGVSGGAVRRATPSLSSNARASAMTASVPFLNTASITALRPSPIGARAWQAAGGSLIHSALGRDG